MTTQTETTQSHHHRAVRLFWCLLIGATLVSLIGNVVHAILPYIPRTVIQIGAATVPPIALLAGRARQGLLLGGQRCCSHRCGRIRREFPSAARSDAGHWLQLGNCMDFPSNH
jgi:hypothetical protein